MLFMEGLCSCLNVCVKISANISEAAATPAHRAQRAKPMLVACKNYQIKLKSHAFV